MDKILIVDDDTDIRRAFRRNLESSELKIAEAGDGTEAIRQVAAERELIVRALGETGSNQLQAAKLLGMTRATLRKRIEKLGIRRRLELS